jgi:succinate-semialdehyde dehydrogenase/glutarate-semialdehyde dehydrogenase
MLDSATDLRSILKDPSLLVEQAYIAGEWVNAADGKTFAVTNPARGDVIANVADMTRADAKRAIEVADKARHEWAARTGKERAAVLHLARGEVAPAKALLEAVLAAEPRRPIALRAAVALYNDRHGGAAGDGLGSQLRVG